ncbi:unnamed protein product [Owenia fusiformis]|uniref:Uncharacterized protein n=1 Tax=Owenia fusiformis TaxID=6347 RepID=A0A8S4QA11_OWEFU|nr:unnamed protein product [Owenia fusiformis]
MEAMEWLGSLFYNMWIWQAVRRNLKDTSCPPPPHWRYTNKKWCCLTENNIGIWHQPYHDNKYKCEKIPGPGNYIIKTCPYGKIFRIFDWNKCYCVPCEWYPWIWSDWVCDPCPRCFHGRHFVTCRRTGTRTRSSNCPHPHSETITETKQKPCHGSLCCRWSDWGPWQYRHCSTTCGHGRKYKWRTRTLISGGPSCPGASIETGYIDCPSHPPCYCGIWDSWGPWTCGPCSIHRGKRHDDDPDGGSSGHGTCGTKTCTRTRVCKPCGPHGKRDTDDASAEVEVSRRTGGGGGGLGCSGSSIEYKTEQCCTGPPGGGCEHVHCSPCPPIAGSCCPRCLIFPGK